MNKIELKTVFLIAGISILLFLCLDLLLGQVYPKVHTPTKYGWDLPENTKVTSIVQDTKGNYRKVTNEYFLHGFKRWPTDSGAKPRVLIIGDSFTQMNYVSNGEEWYAYLERAFPDISFYVFGAGGYGTLQEFMVMDDHIDTIKPDAIIWQFCSNDYSNNNYELDAKEYPLNNHAIRPYWENGAVVYRLPLPYPHLRKYSFTADRLLNIYDGQRQRNAKKDFNKLVEFFVAAKKTSDSKTSAIEEGSPKMKTHRLLTDRAVTTTRALAQQVRTRAGDIPIYFFQPIGEVTADNREVCEAGEFILVCDIGDYMERIPETGIQIGIEEDGHWNLMGNKYAGEKFVECFQKMDGFVSDQRHLHRQPGGR